MSYRRETGALSYRPSLLPFATQTQLSFRTMLQNCNASYWAFGLNSKTPLAVQADVEGWKKGEVGVGRRFLLLVKEW